MFFNEMLKSRISGHFEQFSTFLSHSKPAYTKLRSTSRGSYFPNSLNKFVLSENVLKPIFCEVEILLRAMKCRIYGYFEQFGPSEPLKSPVYYQRSIFRDSYFPKSLHKILLPENVLKAIFCEVEMLLKCTKVVYMVILSCFGHADSLKSPIYYQRSII